MQRDLDALTKTAFDLVVIGGGVNGAATAEADTGLPVQKRALQAAPLAVVPQAALGYNPASGRFEERTGMPSGPSARGWGVIERVRSG